VAQSPVGAAALNFEVCTYFTNRVRESSGGRLDIKFEPGDAIVPMYDELFGVSDGILDMAHTSPQQNMDVIPSAPLFGGLVGGPGPATISLWLDQGGGNKYLDQTYSPWNVVCFSQIAHAQPAPEIWAHTNKKLNSLADFKGIKMRCAGDGGAILSKMGAETVSMPGGDIYEAMQRGVIDAFEFSNAARNWSQSFQEVAKYLYFSGTRAPAEVGYIIVNTDSWNALPNDLKALVKAEWRATVHWAWNYTTTGILAAIGDFKNYGCELYHVPADIEEELLKQAEIYYGEKAAADPVYAEILKAELEFSAVHQEQLGFDAPATDYVMQFKLP